MVWFSGKNLSKGLKRKFLHALRGSLKPGVGRRHLAAEALERERRHSGTCLRDARNLSWGSETPHSRLQKGVDQI